MITSMTTQRLLETPRDLLRVTDLSEHEFDHLLYTAERMKARPYDWQSDLPGRMISCYFEKPSTRTRVSFAGAAARLGMTALWLRPDELQLGRGEPIADTARVLASYSAAIVVRTFDQHVVEEIAAASDVPVINALTDQHHPCQALADYFTLREHFGDIHGLRLAYIGTATTSRDRSWKLALLRGSRSSSPRPSTIRSVGVKLSGSRSWPKNTEAM